MWLHGSKAPIEKLNPEGSGMNLWGKKGVYMTQDVNVAARFGPCINRYSIDNLRILNVDDNILDEHYTKIFNMFKSLEITSSAIFSSQFDTYADVVSIAAEFSYYNREDIVEALQKELGFNALQAHNVQGSLDGETFSEGTVLTLLDVDAATLVDYEYVRMPSHKVDAIPESITSMHIRFQTLNEAIKAIVENNASLPLSSQEAMINERFDEDGLKGNASVVLKMLKWGRGDDIVDKLGQWNPIVESNHKKRQESLQRAPLVATPRSR